LPNKNYLSLGHKNIAPGNRRCGKREGCHGGPIICHLWLKGVVDG
jgi:hypothetical protein